jgi:hypothetical protein
VVSEITVPALIAAAMAFLQTTAAILVTFDPGMNGAFGTDVGQAKSFVYTGNVGVDNYIILISEHLVNNAPISPPIALTYVGSNSNFLGGYDVIINATIAELLPESNFALSPNALAPASAHGVNSDTDIVNKLLLVSCLTGGGAQVWYFEDANGADIDSVELTLIATLSGVEAYMLSSGDFI